MILQLLNRFCKSSQNTLRKPLCFERYLSRLHLAPLSTPAPCSQYSLFGGSNQQRSQNYASNSSYHPLCTRYPKADCSFARPMDRAAISGTRFSIRFRYLSAIIASCKELTRFRSVHRGPEHIQLSQLAPAPLPQSSTSELPSDRTPG